MPPKTPRQGAASAASTPTVPASPLITYAFRDIVLAKVKGHPAWPARIIDPNTAPMNLRDERKIAQKNSYLVKFFKTADYAWMNAKEICQLQPSDIRAFVNNPNKKGADLKAAYQIALAPDAWEAEIEEIDRQYAEELQEQQEQQSIELDELENGETEEEPAIPPPKLKPKRKRTSEVKPRAKSTKKRKSEVISANGSVHASATPEPASTPASKKGRKKKEEQPVIDGETTVREWRHRLQRVFLGKADATEKMMPEIDEVFKDIEAFDMKTEWLTSSKLGKVLKRVGVLDDSKIPLNDQYHIRARARALQEKWRQAFGIGEDSANRSAPMDEAAGEVKGESKLAANGHGEKNETVAPDKTGLTEEVSHPEMISSVKAALTEEVNQPDGTSPEKAALTEEVNQLETISSDKAPDGDDKMEIDSHSGAATSADAGGEAKAADPSAETVSARVNGNDDLANENDKPAMTKDHVLETEQSSATKSEDDDDDQEDGEQMDCSDSPEPAPTEVAKKVDDARSEAKETME